jgi:CspA family cold shock protein
MASGEGAPIRATVKWFNTAKGFGFVTPEDGSPEAFLHLSALKQAGFESVGEGAGMVVEIGQSPKGRQVLRVLEVDNSIARAPAPRMRPGPGPGGPGMGNGMGGAPISTEGAIDVDGVVKWFSSLKGYGFVSPNDGGKDVFVHITILRNAGVETLMPGQPVRMKVVTARKGPEAVGVQITGPTPADPDGGGYR